MPQDQKVPQGENCSEALCIAYLIRVISDLYHLSMSCHTHAHFFVGRVLHLAACVADCGLHDTRHTLKGEFQTPKAPAEGGASTLKGAKGLAKHDMGGLECGDNSRHDG